MIAVDQMKYTDNELIEMWRQFGDVPITDRDEIEAEFLDFPVGTDRFDIWHWFDEQYSRGVKQLIEDVDRLLWE